jgi:hypothetical protein
MGEISEMILEGLLCEVCGVYLQDYEEKPFPHLCLDCESGK